MSQALRECDAVELELQTSSLCIQLLVDILELVVFDKLLVIPLVERCLAMVVETCFRGDEEIESGQGCN